MKRNELRLCLWNSLGGSIIDEKLLAEMCHNLSDEELGVWFELFSNSQICDSFMQVYAQEQQFKQLLSQHPYYQKMVGGYLEMMSAPYFETIKKQVAARTYQYWLEAIQELYPFNFDKQVIVLRVYCLDMLDKLKDSKIDVSKSEAVLLETLMLDGGNLDDELLYVCMTLILQGIPWTSEVEEIEKVYLMHQERLEEYAKEMN